MNTGVTSKTVTSVRVESNNILAVSSTILHDIPPTVDITPSTTQFGIVLGFSGSHGALVESSIGQIAATTSLLCLNKSKLYWMIPTHCTRASDIPAETQMILMRLSKENKGQQHEQHETSRYTYAVLLAMIDNNTFRASLRPPPPNNTNNKKNSIFVRMESGDNSVTSSTFKNCIYIASGTCPFELLDTAIVEAAALSGTARPRWEKPTPPALDYFCWCSWDAFYWDVSPAGLSQGLESLRRGGTPARTVLIDDGWQTTGLDDGEIRGKQKQRDHVLKEKQQLQGKAVSGVIIPVLEQTSAAKSSSIGTPSSESSSAQTQTTTQSLGLSSLASDNAFQVSIKRVLSEVLASDQQQLQPLLHLEKELLAKEEQEQQQLRRQTATTATTTSATVSRAVLFIVAAIIAAPLAFVARVFSSMFKWLQQLQYLIAIFIIRVVQRFLEGTPSDSTLLWTVAALARGPLRRALIRFYAEASHHSRRLLNISANSKFSSLHNGPINGPINIPSSPSALRQFISDLKQQHNIKYVVTWTALCGYWAGLSPDSEEMKQYDPKIMTARPSPGTIEVDPSILWVHPAIVGLGVPQQPEKFHDALMSYLASSGVDGVKIDVQSTITMFGYGSGGGPAIAARFHKSMEESVHRNFSERRKGRGGEGKRGGDGEKMNGEVSDTYNKTSINSTPFVLNSMCTSIEDLYNLSHSNVCRVGEDFYPSIPASHTAHLSNAAFTSLLISPLAYVDWDMFQSSHQSAQLHAAARSISGGMIYVSDIPGRHDFDSVLKRLVFLDGSVFRCILPGRPTEDCLFRDVARDGKTVLKVWSMNDVNGVVGVFNVQGASWQIKKRAYYAHDIKPRKLQVMVKVGDLPTRWLRKMIGREREGNAGGDMLVEGSKDKQEDGGDNIDNTKFIIYSDKTKQMHVVCGSDGRVEEMLEGGGGFDLLCISPVLCSIICGDGDGDGVTNAFINDHRMYKVEVSVVGYINMFNCGGGIMKCGMCVEYMEGERCSGDSSGGGKRGRRDRGSVMVVCKVLLRAHGQLLVYSSRQPSRVEVEGGGVEFRYDENRSRLMIEVPEVEDCSRLSQRELRIGYGGGR